MVSASRIAAESLRVVPRKRLSRMMGRLADLAAPTPVVSTAVDAFVKVYGVDLSEAEVPVEGFQTFDAFFTRRLKPGVRPINPGAEVLTSPADGKVVCAERLTGDRRFRVKGRSYDLAELADDFDAPKRFEGGFVIVVYLAPPDYHRIHAASAGPIHKARYVAGTLYPVNSIGEHVPELFGRNERIIVEQQSPVVGDFLSILVGAMGVGRVSLAFDSLTTNRPGSITQDRDFEPAIPIKKGDELGMFHLGSTVILVAEKCAGELLVKPGDRVRVGQAIFNGAKP